MSHVKFTPGPWRWDSTVWDYDPDEYTPWLISRGSNPVLRGEIHCNHEADAHLIAAAPELYDALKAITYACQMEGLPNLPGKIGLAWKIMADGCNKVLAKARGEE